MATMNIWRYHERVKCPFVSFHRVKFSKLHTHIRVCPYNPLHPKKGCVAENIENLEQCPYSEWHWYDRRFKQQHLDNCDYAKRALKDILDKPMWGKMFRNQNITLSPEVDDNDDWDKKAFADEDKENVTPLAGRKRKFGLTQQTLIDVYGLSRKKRKLYSQQQTARLKAEHAKTQPELQGLDDLEPASVSSVVTVDFVPDCGGITLHRPADSCSTSSGSIHVGIKTTT